MKEISKEGGPGVAQRTDYRKTALGRTRSRKPRQSYARRRMIGALVVGGLLAFVGVFGFMGVSGGGDEIRRNVRVGAVDVGGMTKGEARAAVEREAGGTFEEIRFGAAGAAGAADGSFSVPGERLGVRVDAASAVDKAYAVGREGGPFERLADLWRTSFGGGVEVGGSDDVVYDEAAARTAVAGMAGDYRREPKNASYSVTDGGEIEVQEAQEGRVLNTEATLANLDRALSGMRSRVPLAEGEAPKPAVTTEEVERSRPTDVIGEYKTDFLWDSNPNRKSNMKLAAGAVDNTVLDPGETFSFNELAAPLDYKEAKTFSDGGVGFANGGGLCQVSSTLYMAANYAGLEIVERHPHYAVLPYIKPGFDATVWFGDEYGYGAQDMRFKNTTDSPVVIREWVDEKGFLNAQILGRPTGTQVEMTTEKIYEDTTRGIKWTTYKTVTEGDRVISDGRLHSYVYSYNPPVPEGVPHYDTTTPRVSGWSDPGNTTGWAEVPE